jgi:hypothetical protein
MPRFAGEKKAARELGGLLHLGERSDEVGDLRKPAFFGPVPDFLRPVRLCVWGARFVGGRPPGRPAIGRRWPQPTRRRGVTEMSSK